MAETHRIVRLPDLRIHRLMLAEEDSWLPVLHCRSLHCGLHFFMVLRTNMKEEIQQR